MQIFISWSGDQSRAVAVALREWLPYVLPTLKVWMSDIDIERGARWNSSISRALDESQIGIICLTAINLGTPWLLFEAGAHSKALTSPLICTYLIGIRSTEVTGPLSQFQATNANQDETKRLVLTINAASGADALPHDRLAKMFDTWWPDLERSLNASLTHEHSTSPQRSQKEILEELLLLQRRVDPDVMLTTIRDEIRAAFETYTLPTQTARSRPEPPGARISARYIGAITVDTRPLAGVKGENLDVPIQAFSTVSDFLDDLYFHVADHVEPGTFGIAWALRETATGQLFKEMGRAWAARNHGHVDGRSLESVGLRPGMHLEALRLSDGGNMGRPS